MKVQIIILLLTAIIFFSCKKEKIYSCSQNCAGFTIQGRLVDAVANKPIANTSIIVKWQTFRSNYISFFKKEVYKGTTDANGHFSINVNLDTSLFSDFVLQMFTPQLTDNYFASYQQLSVSPSITSLDTEIVLYPKTTLSVNLKRVKTDSIKSLLINRQWKEIRAPFETAYTSFYIGNGQSELRDTTLILSTVAGLLTIISLDKQLISGVTTHIKDSIVCNKNGNNLISINY